jgi:hypothetical protein
MADNTTTDVALLENVNILIAHSSEEGGTTEGSGARSDDSDGFLIRRWKILWQRWISDLRDTHFLKDSNGEFLKPVNLDCSLFSFTNIAISCAKLRDWA